jgi:membrane associated rhomboid family serine protease
MQSLTHPRITPWVLRLGLANVAVLLLLETLFISPGLHRALSFDPALAGREPWTFLTYMFVHGDLLHLLVNLAMLYVFGCQLEARMAQDGRHPSRFLVFYLYCGIGAALFATLFSALAPVNPFVGASGAVLGVVVGLAMMAPEAEVIGGINARTAAVWLVGFNLVMALPFLPFRSGIAYEAHVGGAMAGYLYFRLQQLRPEAPPPARRPAQRPVMVQPGAAEMEHPEHATPTTPVRRARAPEPDPVAREIDRVLDKISAQGIGSLTADERRFLDEVARRKRTQN